MYITATALSMDASQTYKEVEQRVSGLTSTPMTAGTSEAFGIRLASMLASTTQTQINCHSAIRRTANSTTSSASSTNGTRQSTTLLSQMTEQVIGQSVTIRALQDSLTTNAALRAMQQAPASVASLQTVSFTRGTVYSQSAALLFSAQGSVQTADGREIGFDLGLSMQQHTVAMETASFAVTGLFIDPLILQFDLDAPLLADTNFLFDIDCDGEMEDVACPGSGCGFLAFDRNGDGRINNGSELFGPESGSGFGELAALDSDANQWIDENDPIFDQLLIWTLDGQGGERRCSLREAGVGAIAVTHAGSAFELRRQDGSVVGTIAASGLFLTEEGEVRPMHEVDLALAGTGETAVHSPMPGDSRENQALQALRDIISMQRLRLRMMLTGKRLRDSLPETTQQHVFLDWLQAQQRLRDTVALHVEEPQNDQSGEQSRSLST